MGGSDTEETVLVVDDEPKVADAYATQLRRQYEVKVAYEGEGALEKVDDSIDVILLDRRMPGLSGDEVLDEIHEWGMECRIIMVSAVDPDFDIVEMPFDEYLCKPVTKDDLFNAIERQLKATQHDERLPEFLELKSKLDALEEEKSSEELRKSDEVEQMRERASELETDLEDVIENFDQAAVDLQDYI